MPPMRVQLNKTRSHIPALRSDMENSLPNLNYSLTTESTIYNNTSNSETITVRYGALSLGVLVLCTIFGNTLVVMAVKRTIRLQSITNYLIVSLAIADITVGTLVMPLAVYVEVLHGSFLLPPTLCDAWVAIDVLACTASILSMTAISIDRFFAIRHPLLYMSKLKQSKLYLSLMIGLTWGISIAIALPIAIGANDVEGRPEDLCAFFNPMFSILSSVGSFVIPTCIMVTLYIVIFKVIRQRATITRMRKSNISVALSNRSESSLDSSNEPSFPILKGSPESQLSNGGVGAGDSKALIIRNDKIRSSYQSEKHDVKPASKYDEKESFMSMENGQKRFDTQTTNDDLKEKRAETKKVDPDHIRNIRFRVSMKVRNVISLQRRSEKQKEHRERKATITLLVVLCVYLICWIPFFVANNLIAIGIEWNLTSSFFNIPGYLMSIFVWLGYINSMLNPIIYACFNTEYRRAFKMLLNYKTK